MRKVEGNEILLLGGTGYVGRALIPQLLSDRHNVNILSRHQEAAVQHSEINQYVGSLDDSTVLKDILPRCNTVVHLASDSTPGSTGRQPALEAELNIIPTLRFLEILQEYPNIHLIYLSSGGTVYGNPEITPVKERNILSPISYHGAGKVAIEAFLHVYSKQFRQAVTILRPSNLYGPGQFYRNGFGIVRTVLEHLRRNMPIEIWGDGEAVRDFIYIEDFIEACIAVISKRKLEDTFRLYNVGSGEGYSINQLCNIIEHITCRPVERIYRQGRASDVRSIILDNTEIRDDFGWEPSMDIERGIKLTWQWVQTEPL